MTYSFVFENRKDFQSFHLMLNFEFECCLLSEAISKVQMHKNVKDK